jgi:hypothetical protein
MHINRGRAFESADYDGWMIGVAPVVSRPCACEAPAWWRDELGTRCVKCGRRRRAGESLPRDEPLRVGNGLDPLADLLR